MFYRVCNDNSSEASCLHSSEEVLDFPDRSLIEDKIQNDCEPFCEEINSKKQQLQNKIDELKGLANSIFNETIKPINDDVTSQDDTLKALHEMDTDDYESLLEGSDDVKADITTKVMDLIHKHKIDKPEVEKLLMETIIDEMGKKSDPDLDRDDDGATLTQKASRFKDSCMNSIFGMRSRSQTSATMTEAKGNEIVERLDKLQKGLDGASEPDYLDRSMKALTGLGNALYKFKGAYTYNATDDSYTINYVRVAAGVLDILDGVASIVGPPFSTITGPLVTVFNLFTNGGLPTQQQVMKNLFEEQNKMIQKEFNETRKYMTDLIGKENLEIVETKAMGILDALNSRYIFIASFDGLEECLSDTVASEITERVDYFTDQSEIFSIRHYFDLKCPELIHANDDDPEKRSQRTACATLLYTELTIERHKKHIISRMIGLLSKTSNHYQLVDGYLQVRSNEEKSLTSWLEQTILPKDLYCNMFHYDMKMWNFGYESFNPRRMSLGMIQDNTKQKLDHLDQNCIDPEAIKDQAALFWQVGDYMYYFNKKQFKATDKNGMDKLCEDQEMVRFTDEQNPNNKAVFKIAQDFKLDLNNKYQQNVICVEPHLDENEENYKPKPIDNCLNGWGEVEGKCYKLFTDKAKNHQDAVYRCGNSIKGGSLYRPKSKSEETKVTKWVHGVYGHPSDYFIGVRIDWVVFASWSTVYYYCGYGYRNKELCPTKMPYTNWDSGQPDWPGQPQTAVCITKRDKWDNCFDFDSHAFLCQSSTI